MKPASLAKTPAQKVKQFQIIVIIVFSLVLIITIANFVIQANTKSQARLSQEQSAAQNQKQESFAAHQEFFTTNPDLIDSINKTLPTQETIIDMVESVESLQTSVGMAKSFEFTATSPSKDVNQTYIPFTIRSNTTMIKAIEFLRRFEKLPYLTKISAINMKSPQGISGGIEIIITGRVYVQDPFKN